MNTKKYLPILIYTITFLFCCVPTPENATDRHAGYNLPAGVWDGLIFPFSITGIALGLDIGIINVAKISDPTYIVGYTFAMYLYFRLLKPLVTHWWLLIKERRH